MRRSAPPPAKSGWALVLLSCAALGCTGGGVAKTDTTQRPPRGDSVAIGRFAMFSFAASGVARLTDGRVLIADDEALHPLVIVDFFATGAVREFLSDDIQSMFKPFGIKELNNLEALTSDRRGHLYLTTSHAISRLGEDKPDRKVMARLDVVGNDLRNVVVLRTLEEAIQKRGGPLAASIGQPAKTLGPPPGLNIEGLAWDPRSSRLVFGLRGPLVHDRALVFYMDNPDDVFDRGAEPRLSGPDSVDLHGSGIRDITFDSLTGGFLIVSGASGQSAFGSAGLWSWTGRAAEPARQLTVPALNGLKPEGIVATTVNGQPILFFVCDDGDLDSAFYRRHVPANRGMPSHYVVLPRSVLRRDNSWMK